MLASQGKNAEATAILDAATKAAETHRADIPVVRSVLLIRMNLDVKRFEFEQAMVVILGSRCKGV